MNNLADLNGILFRQIEALENPELTQEEFQREIEKSDAMVKVSAVILKNAEIALNAQKHFDDYGINRSVDIPLLGITNDNLLIENKNLRRRLADKESYD